MQLVGGYAAIASERDIGTTFDLVFPAVAA
jgi:hypothetical protein